MLGVVDGVVQAAALLALERLAGDEVAHVNHVAQLANVAGSLYVLVKFLSLLVEQVEACPSTLQAQVGAHNAHIGRHNLFHLLHVLCYEHLLLVGERTLVVPFGHAVVEVVLVDVLNRMLGCCVGVNYCLDERVAGQTVAAMQPGA